MSTPTANAGSASTADTTRAVAALLRSEVVAVDGWDLAVAGGAGAGTLNPVVGGAARDAAWVVGGIDEVIAKVGTPAWAVRRLMRRLAPGPIVVRFAPADGAGAPQGAVGADGLLAVACPEGRGLSAVLEGVRARDAKAALLGVERSGAAKPASVVSVIKTPMGTSVRVDRAGTYEERFVRKQLERTLLFVCTGNTCRSPMAEAIAASLIEDRGDTGTLHTASAGISATPGEPVSREVEGALDSVGVPLSGGRTGSRGLTARIIEDADAVYVMTRAHRQAVVGMSPRSAAKVHVLDPGGADVPDPIGQGSDVYSATARRLKELIAARLEELDS